MNPSLPKRFSALIFGLSVLSMHAWAAPRAVETFDSKTWPQLQAELKRPAVAVFTTTDCVHCPAVIDSLTRGIRQRRLKADLTVVVMDQAPGDNDAALLSNKHYRQVDRLFAFAGQAPALRYAVDPRWRGATPYVVFMAPKAPALAVTGPPSAADFDAWVRASSGHPGEARP